MKDKEYIKVTTNTDADLKGISLQKHRALKRLLESIEKDEQGIFVAIEYMDDVLEMDMNSESTGIVMEQDKNYESKKFTLNSEEVLKSLRIFFDNYRRVEESEQIKFIFYTNTSFTKEHNTTVLKELGIILPKVPMLKLISDKNYDEVLPLFKKIFGKFYIDFNRSKTDDIAFYEEVIYKRTDTQWISFLNSIEWNFGSVSVEEIWGQLLDAMKRLSKKMGFDEKFCDGILKSFLEQLDQNTRKTDFFDKVLSTAEVKVVLQEYILEHRIKERIDPIFSRWDDLENFDLNRGLKEKINSVCSEYDQSIIFEMLDDYIDGTIEFNNVVYPAQAKSYKYRIFKIASRIIKDKLTEKDTPKFDEYEINQLITEIINEAYEHILDKNKTYEMPFLDKDMVRKTVVILIEDCFICFEEEAKSDGIKEETNVQS